jgi:serine/threonine-protein kinase RsbW
MNRSESAAFETVSGPETLADIARFLDEALSSHQHVPDTVRMQVSIAAGEIGANIMEHAGRAQPVNIRMEVRVLIDEVWVEFVDNGAPAELDLTAVGMPDDMAERGRGLALAQAVLEKLTYRRNAKNHWTLVSRRFP